MRIISLLALIIANLLSVQAQTQRSTADAVKWARALELDSLGKTAQAVKLYTDLTNEPAWAYKAYMARSGAYFVVLHDYQEAFMDLAKAMELEPDSIAPYLNRSACYITAKMPDRALSDLDEALVRARDREDSISVFVNQASALFTVRKFDVALTALDKALLLDSTSMAVLLNKATALDELGKQEEA